MNKTNEQLHEEMEQALKVFTEKLYNLLHFGSYELVHISRDFRDHKVDFAQMKIGEHRVFLKVNDEGSEVHINFTENPVNKELLEAYDRQTIDNDIDYHKRQIEALETRKKDLAL